MTAGFTARTVTRLQKWFPERQLYHRSDGHVQFVVLSPRFQMIGVVVGFMCLSWFAYSSVMTVFKNEIVAAKEERVRTLQQKYEAQIAQMRLDYDDLTVKLALAENRFSQTVEAIERRQGELQTAMSGQAEAGDALAEVTRRAATVAALGLGPSPTAQPMQEEDDPSAVGGEEDAADAKPGKAPAKKTDDKAAPPAPKAKPRAALEGAADTKLAAAPAIAPGAPSPFLATDRNAAFGVVLAGLEDRLAETARSQRETAHGIAEAAYAREDELRAVLDVAGMDADAIAPRDADAMGGPFIPMEDAPPASPFEADPNLALAQAALERAEALKTAMLSAPLANPIPGVTRISSGFGGRRDPFSGGRAYHSGLDFKGPFATDIIATAPGVVTVADWHGGYGKMVEIDHGYGLKTRYAHLSAIDVVEGQKVAFGHKVGEMGSTGRSTGPHLHYEIWQDGQARNPWNYLKAGANVLQRQGT